MKGKIEMKIVIAPDSFKGSMDSVRIINIVERAARKIFPGCEVIKIPIADGGEGTVDAILSILKGKAEYLEVLGPLYEKTNAKFGIIDNKTIIIEMSAASGLPLVSEEKRNPLNTTTYGTGQLIKHALDTGFTSIIIAIGGSATNDGGTGAMEALGVRFLDKQGKQVKGIGKNLIQIEDIDIQNMHPQIKNANITVMCDVENTFTGKNGATFVYGRQKGGTDEILFELEAGMLHFQKLIKEKLKVDISNVAGAGAAGGLGGALFAFLNAKLQSGIRTVLETIRFDELLDGVDLVITGEGKLDGQSAFGKVLAGIGQESKKKNIPAAAIVGCIGEGADNIYEYGIESSISTINNVMSLQEAMEHSDELLESAAERMFRMICIGMKIKSERDVD
jgi:glycerate kinase